MDKLTGKCLCEGVSYEISGKLGPIYNCHCSKCRRWHGSAFRTRATVKTEQFTWCSGEELLASFHSSHNTAKWFCSVCGSNLISTYDDRTDVIGVPLGGIEQDPGHRPEGHIFAASKSPWHEIHDDLPQYETWPGSEAVVKRTTT
ncbi:MAG: GFA family protein [Pseudomonadales bacterium]